MNAPRSWPSSSLSTRFAATEPQSKITNGFPDARAAWWTASARGASFPAPVSPRMVSVTSVCARRRSVSSTSRMTEERAVTRPKLKTGASCAREGGVGPIVPVRCAPRDAEPRLRATSINAHSAPPFTVHVFQPPNADRLVRNCGPGRGELLGRIFPPLLSARVLLRDAKEVPFAIAPAPSGEG